MTIGSSYMESIDDLDETTSLSDVVGIGSRKGVFSRKNEKEVNTVMIDISYSKFNCEREERVVGQERQ